MRFNFTVFLCLALISCKEGEDITPLKQRTLNSIAWSRPIIQFPANINHAHANFYARVLAAQVGYVNTYLPFSTMMFYTSRTYRRVETKIASNYPLTGETDFITFVSPHGERLIQFSENSSQYFYESMYAQGNEWVKAAHLQENKDKLGGKCILFESSTWPDEPEQVQEKYEWSINADEEISISYEDVGWTYASIRLNRTTLEGSMDFRYLEDFDLDKWVFLQMSWNQAGKGTWKELDADGAILDSGEWTN